MYLMLLFLAVVFVAHCWLRRAQTDRARRGRRTSSLSSLYVSWKLLFARHFPSRHNGRDQDAQGRNKAQKTWWGLSTVCPHSSDTRPWTSAEQSVRGNRQLYVTRGLAIRSGKRKAFARRDTGTTLIALLWFNRSYLAGSLFTGNLGRGSLPQKGAGKRNF